MQSKLVFTSCSVSNLLPEATDWWATPPKFLVQDRWGHLYLNQLPGDADAIGPGTTL